MTQKVVDSEAWLTAVRRRLPWQLLEKEYRFRGDAGEVSLQELFDGRSQLQLYHFMFHPNWDEACKSCSFRADSYNAFFRHLNQRDVTLVAVLRAPLEKLQAFAGRMGWHFPWYSSYGSDFNYDFRVSFSDEQIAAGSVDYNFRMTEFMPKEARVSVSFAAMMTTRSIEPTAAIHVAWICSMAPITTSTWHPRGVTNLSCPFPWPGLTSRITMIENTDIRLVRIDEEIPDQRG